jgi:predicted transcriptional regulator YdeE
MQEYSHEAFEVSGYNVTITNIADSQTIIQEAWGKFMKQGLMQKVEHKVGPHVHAVYYNYHDIRDPDKFGYDMLLCFITETGAKQTSEDIITITIPAQDYKYTEATGDFVTVLPIEWAKINNMPKEEVSRSYGYDLEMYSEDYKTVTLAVSVNK